MNWKKTVISLALALICTLLMMFGIQNYMQLPKGILILGFFIFDMFVVIFTSIYDIIKKKNVKLNVWLALEGINAIILILSFSSILAMDNGLLKITLPFLPIGVTSLILFFIISGICMKIEQNMKEKQEKESI